MPNVTACHYSSVSLTVLLILLLLLLLLALLSVASLAAARSKRGSLDVLKKEVSRNVFVGLPETLHRSNLPSDERVNKMHKMQKVVLLYLCREKLVTLR